MSTDYQPLSIYRVSENRRQESESGSIALVALVVMLVVSVLGMTLLYFVRGGAASTHEYLRETQLEVAARAALADTEYLVTSANPDIVALTNGTKKALATLTYGGSSYSDGYGITVTVTALRRDDYIYMIACAIESNPEVRYERREIVKGVWLKDGNGKYVYQGWAP